MPFNEADTRAKLIDPALHERDWPEDWIRREQTPGPFVRTGAGYERGQGRTDYVLYVPGPNDDHEMLPIAVVEAKAESAAADAGIEQAKRDARLHSVPFAFATNGRQFHETDLRTNATRGPLPMQGFPRWETLRNRWQRPGGETAPLNAASDAASPLWTPQREGARYYQRAARRAALETIARGKNRILLPLATGAGKTWIAVSILRAIDAAGQLRRALFLCDRDELRNQALGALAAHFGSDAAKATTRDPAANARVVVATYQTLGIDKEDGSASFLRKHYPKGYFSHIVIDECHRSAWGKWREVLDRNPNAIHIGLTATPREIDTGKANAVNAVEERRISADNYRYFGEPAYEYSIAQAMQDGYLAAMEIVQSDVWTAETLDRLQGVERDRLRGANVKDARTGEAREVRDLREQYAGSSLEQSLQLPDRVSAMTADLFQRLVDAGGPLQKTLIFCASIAHANAVVQALNNRYADWCRANGEPPAEPYAFACTAQSGRELIADLRGSRHRAFIAVTVDLVTTGVDVPCLQNLVYFRYIESPIPSTHCRTPRCAKRSNREGRQRPDGSRRQGKERVRHPAPIQLRRRVAIRTRAFLAALPALPRRTRDFRRPRRQDPTHPVQALPNRPLPLGQLGKRRRASPEEAAGRRSWRHLRLSRTRSPPPLAETRSATDSNPTPTADQPDRRRCGRNAGGYRA